MKKYTIKPLKASINAELLIPGSIGYTIRALNIAAMTKGTVKIIDPLKSDDTYSMINALKSLGIKIVEGENYFKVIGDIHSVKNITHKIDIGLSGRTARTILALLCIVPGEKLLTCHNEFKKRPVGGLIDALRMLGAEIEYLEEKNYLPVRIKSHQISARNVIINGEKSSQYLSAILMIAPVINATSIEVEGEQVSKPFIDMTIDIMKKFGVNVKNDNYKHYNIQTNQSYTNPESYVIEPEATAASYFWAIAAITNSKIKILNLGPNSKQGDIKFADILEKMNCKVIKNASAHLIEVIGSNELNGIDIDMNNTPDLVPTLAVVAAFAKGKTRITNIAHAKIKESDRIESSKAELEKMKINVNSSNDSLLISGGVPAGARINPHNDHRIAMSFAVAGTKIPGIIIDNPDVVNKSFPDFWRKLEDIGIKIERRISQ